MFHFVTLPLPFSPARCGGRDLHSESPDQLRSLPAEDLQVVRRLWQGRYFTFRVLGLKGYGVESLMNWRDRFGEQKEALVFYLHKPINTVARNFLRKGRQTGSSLQIWRLEGFRV